MSETRIENDGPYTLRRDDKDIMTGTLQECWSSLHRHSSNSVDWSCKYEGYAIIDERPGSATFGLNVGNWSKP